MKNKRLFVLILSAAMTLGSVPAVSFASDETQIEEAATFSFSAGDEQQETFPETTPEITPEATPEITPEIIPETTPEVTPEVIPETTPEITPEITPETTPEVTPEIAPDPTATPTVAPTEVPEPEASDFSPTMLKANGEKDPKNPINVNGTIYAATELQKAINEAADTTPDGTPVEIEIRNDIVLEATIVIPENKNIMLVAGAKDISITRKAGFTDEMFSVEGGVLQFSGNTLNENGSESNMGMTVNGKLETAETTSSMIKVVDGILGLNEGVTLKGNHTEENGGAIYCEKDGSVLFFGGTITENIAKNGGAIYSEGSIGIQGSVTIADNTATDETENNIYLVGESAGIIVTGALKNADIHVKKEDAVEGDVIVVCLENVTDTTLEEAIAFLTYEDDSFLLGTDGKLTANTEVTPTVTPTPNVTTTPTATPTPTVTPTPSPKPEKGLIKGVSMAWGPDGSTASAVFYTTKSGQYYYNYVVDGEPETDFDFSQPGEQIAANKNTTINLWNLDSSKKYKLYIRLKADDGTYSVPFYFIFEPLSITPTPIPDVSVTPTTAPTRDPKVPSVSESKVTGLETALEFYPGQFYPFTVVGAGSDNTSPIKGDVKWVPLYWSTSSNPSDSDKHTSWKIGVETGGITQAATFNMYIFYQRYEHNGTNWVATDTISSVKYPFYSASITITPSPTGTVDEDDLETGTGTVSGSSGGYYDSSGNYVSYQQSGSTSAVSYEDEASTERLAVATADHTPVGTFLFMLMISMITAGFVLIRKNKKVS